MPAGLFMGTIPVFDREAWLIRDSIKIALRTVKNGHGKIQLLGDQVT